LLAGQVETAKAAAEAAANAPRMMVIGEQTTSAADVTMLEHLDVSLGIGTLLEITAISLILASAAGLAAIGKITKYEPIKILTER
jgi:putative ABC transport system permease protein